MLAGLPSATPAGEAGQPSAPQLYLTLQLLREPVFDEVVNLTARIFHVPISLIGLVGPQEMNYLANCGLPGLWHQPRPEAICSMVVAQNQAVVFTDLSLPEQYQALQEDANLAAQAKGLRFYAGMPLRMPTQEAVGTLCIIDRRERTFTAHERRILEQLSRLVERLLLVRQACLANGRAAIEQWPPVQAYVSSKVQALSSLVRQLSRRLRQRSPVPPAILGPVIRYLNELSWVLAEPLPDGS